MYTCTTINTIYIVELHNALIYTDKNFQIHERHFIFTILPSITE